VKKTEASEQQFIRIDRWRKIKAINNNNNNINNNKQTKDISLNNPFLVPQIKKHRK
jgi:hypothetical protein